MPKGLIVALVWTGSLCLFTSCDEGPRSDPATEPAALRAAPEPRRVSATGFVKGLREADVCAKMPGRIADFFYEEGDAVEADAPVAHLEDRDLQATLKQATAAAAAACNTFERIRALTRQGVIAASKFDHAQAACARRTAEAEHAAVMLDYAIIRAPFTGTLVHRFKEVGEAVSGDTPPDPVFLLADLSALKVTAEVPESDIAMIRLGQAAQVTADAYLGETFAAIVSKIALAVGRKRLRSDDPRERLDEKVVEVELDLNAKARLRSGMTVDVAILVSEAGSRGSQARPYLPAQASSSKGDSG